MKNFYFTKFSLSMLIAFTFFYVDAQTGNWVFSGAEMTNFGTISLSTPAGKTWTTDRLASPGYFSATNGAVFSNASDADNINGYVKKYGNQAFTYPVGTGADIRTLSISAPGAATDAYATAWILGNPSGNLDPTGPNGGPHNVTSTTFPINAVSTIGQWDWQTGIDMGTTGNGVGLTITASMPDMTAFAVTVGLRLVGWNGTSWVDLSGWPTATGNTENSTITGTMIAGISAIGIGSTWWVLPLKLVSFTARENGCAAVLNWTTTNEQNMDRFEVEKSDNGNTYHSVGIINAAGNNNENNYSFTDNQPGVASYYRLRMTEKDGSFTYSPVKYLAVNCKTTAESVLIYPNPVNQGFVFADFTTEIKGGAKLKLINALGQQIKTMDIIVTQGHNIVKFDVNEIPIGLYFIQLISLDNKAIFQPQKIIIE